MPCDTAARHPRIAVTGATGFIGRQFLKDCAAINIQVSALTRQSQPETAPIRWVPGDLSAPEALMDLVDGADCVIHLAGLTKALHPQDFHRINVEATAQLTKICVDQKVRHLIFLSSLAAMRPFVSPYAASKAAMEEALAEYHKHIVISTIRAPAVLGPGDAATHLLFSNLAKGILPVPGGPARTARFSIIDVADLSALMLSLARKPDTGAQLITPYGHQSLGWQDVADCATRVLHRPVRQLVVPAAIMALAARITDLVSRLTGKAQVFSRDKLREMHAGDWIGESPVDHPTPLDETLTRCLAPYQKQPVRAA